MDAESRSASDASRRARRSATASSRAVLAARARSPLPGRRATRAATAIATEPAVTTIGSASIDAECRSARTEAGHAVVHPPVPVHLAVHAGAGGRSPRVDSVPATTGPFGLRRRSWMRNRRKWLVLLAAVASLSLVAAACGDDDGGGTGHERRQRHHGPGPDRHDRGLRLLDGAPDLEPGRRALQRGRVPERPDHRGRPGDGRRLRPVLRRRDRHQRRLASDRAGRGGRVLGERHRVHRARRRLRRHHGHDEPRERGRDLPEQGRPLRAVRARVRRHRHVGRRRLARERRSAGPTASRAPRSRSRRPARSRAPTTRSSSSPGSRTPRSRRAFRRTRPPRSAPTTSPRRTTT